MGRLTLTATGGTAGRAPVAGAAAGGLRFGNGLGLLPPGSAGLKGPGPTLGLVGSGAVSESEEPGEGRSCLIVGRGAGAATRVGAGSGSPY